MARGSIVKRGNVYQVRYRIGKKQKGKIIGTNKKDAERVLAKIMNEIHSGSYTELKEVTFKEFCEKWLRDYAKMRVKDSTYDNYENVINCHLLPRFAKYPLSHITQERIEKLMSKLTETRSPKTINNVLVQLKTMFKLAKQWNYVKENPVIEISKLKERDKKEMDFLNPNEINQLFKHAHDEEKTILMTALLTGMRMGELFALQWGDVDWNNNKIIVRRNLYRSKQKKKDLPGERWKFVTPKSKRSRRAIVMSPKLKEALEIHRITARINEYDLLFCNDEGNPVDLNNYRNRRFLPILRMSGLRHIRFHDLRHTYCALLIAQGENIKFIQNQMGHASIQTTLDTYGHLLPCDTVDVGSRIDSQIFTDFGNIMGTKQSTNRGKTGIQEEEKFLVTYSNTYD